MSELRDRIEVELDFGAELLVVEVGEDCDIALSYFGRGALTVKLELNVKDTEKLADALRECVEAKRKRNEPDPGSNLPPFLQRARRRKAQENAGEGTEEHPGSDGICPHCGRPGWPDEVAHTLCGTA